MLVTALSIITTLCTTQPDLYECVTVKAWQKDWWAFSPYIHTIQTINRRNNGIRVGQTVAIPKAGEDLKLYSPFPLIGVHWNTVIIDLKKLAWAYYDENGNMVTWGAATGGTKICSDTGLKKCKTPVGTWRVLRKGGYLTRSKLYPLDCENKSQCGAKMFYYMQFSPDGAGLHGSDYGLNGKNMSHGCVRMFHGDAKLLNKKLTNEQTTIIVEDY